MEIVFLDADTMGRDVTLASIASLGHFIAHPHTGADQVLERCSHAEVVITNKVVLHAETLALLPRLKLICVAATGTNNVDLSYAHSHNILVKNAVDYSTKSVAQHTFTMLFALIGNISWYDTYVKSGAYTHSKHFTNLERPYYEIAGKTWGIIGMGTIGRAVAALATAFGCKVQYASISGAARQEAYDAVPLEKLLAESDIVSIHSPLTDKTRNLLDAEKIALLKPSSVLINVGRGGIVQEQALAQALEQGKIAGACIDVFDKEPMDPDNPLLRMTQSQDRIVMTPHTAWASQQAREKLISIIANHITQYASQRT